MARSAVPAEDPGWTYAYGQMLEASLCLFADDVLHLELGPHLLAWEDLINNHRRIAVNAARDHSKSTFFSYAYPIWRAWSEPGCEVYIFSKTLDQAMEFLDIIVYGKNNLKGMVDIPELAHLVPLEGSKRGANERLKRTDVRLTNGSRFRAIGYGKAIRGAHPKYIVLDDPLNDDDMWSDVQRKKHIEYFKSAITNMVPPDGQICIVGTPYHVSDLYGWLRKNKRYVFRRFPGIIKDKSGEDQALFPWRWSLQQLYEKKEEIGSVSFAREILCEPITDDLAIFPSYLFPPCFDNTLKLRPTLPEIESRGLAVSMGVDIARSASVGADYFVIFLQGKDPQGSRYLIDIQSWKGISFNEQLQHIEIAYRRYMPGLVFIEANAMQQVWSDELRRTTDVPVKEFVTLASNKYPLDKGVPSLRILLENRKIIIPRGDAYSVKVTDEWIEQATQFGYIDGKLQGIGEHDDQVMAWWFAEEATKAGAFSFGFGDEGEDEEDDMAGGDVNWEEEMLGEDSEFSDAQSL
jgi:hypothetical protein